MGEGSVSPRPKVQSPRAKRKEAGLSSATRKRIFGALKALGISDEDARYDIQRSIVGKLSLTQFSESDGRELLAHLNGLRGQKPNTKEEEKETKGATNYTNYTKRGKSSRKKYTRDDGIIVMYPRPDAPQKQRRFAYALMHEIIDLESRVTSRESRVENYSEDAGKRLDGWAKKLTNGEAERLGELMAPEIVKLTVQLRNRRDYLKKKMAKESE